MKHFSFPSHEKERKRLIYLDYAATTPMSQVALDAYMEASKKAFGNANSLHDIGGLANEYLMACRRVLASLIGGESGGVTFTSGGTESNLLAIDTLLHNAPHKKKHIVISHLEHSSIRNYVQFLQKKGCNITFVENDTHGRIDVSTVKRAIRQDTAFVSIQHGNSEMGIIQPIEEIGRFLKEKNIFFHTDCVQTFGKIPFDVKQVEASAYSFSSHKIYGPKGVGAVYFDPSLQLKPLIKGTTHENGFRAGTVNVPGICSFVTAVKHFEQEKAKHMEHFWELRTYLLKEIKKASLPVKIINEERKDVLPHIVGLISEGYEGQYLMLELNRKGIAISTGTACQAGNTQPSPTLLSIGIEGDKLHHFIRVSFGINTTKQEINHFIEAMKDIVL